MSDLESDPLQVSRSPSPDTTYVRNDEEEEEGEAVACGHHSSPSSSSSASSPPPISRSPSPNRNAEVDAAVNSDSDDDGSQRKQAATKRPGWDSALCSDSDSSAAAVAVAKVGGKILPDSSSDEDHSDEAGSDASGVPRKQRRVERRPARRYSSSSDSSSSSAEGGGGGGGDKRRIKDDGEDSEVNRDEEEGEEEEAGSASAAGRRILDEDDSDHAKPEPSRDEEEDEESKPETSGWDFDIMMDKKKQENRRYRRRKDIDIINDNDDAIARLIADMRQAAREDRTMNEKKLPATKKIGMLPLVMKKLSKIDLQYAFIEANVLAVMTDWLSPLPVDKSLPHVQIRTKFLTWLKAIPIDDYSRLKESGIGKAIMYLYRHPKEVRPNKDLAGSIINKWSRPIFHLSADFSALTREDRQVRDLEMAAKLGLNKRKRKDSEASSSGSRPSSSSAAESKPAVRPGDPGWVGRARVPMPDNREFVCRPEWQSHEDMSKTTKKEMDMLEKHKRSFADRKKFSKAQHAVKISLEGKGMKL